MDSFFNEVPYQAAYRLALLLANWRANYYRKRQDFGSQGLENCQASGYNDFCVGRRVGVLC